jgi:3'-phosphoadenosine 5'-phosphosulfate sulfotransferase (PAPS reductase)/FAD synthetase
MIIAWWSAGVTSAVATKLAVDKYGVDNVRIIYFKIDSAHSDNDRFLKECEKWYGKDIEVIQGKYKDQFDVIEQTKYVNGPQGARCTLELKKKLRFAVEKDSDNIDGQIFGFECSPKEVNRAIRFKEQYPYAKPLFPLIDAKMTKSETAYFLRQANIELPKMYALGYPNNNCVGCVKGGQGYWNKIRVDFPSSFERMAKLEKKVGRSCLKTSVKGEDGEKTSIPLFLEELNPEAGRKSEVVMADCGNFCDIEFGDVIDDRVELVMKGQMSLELI